MKRGECADNRGQKQHSQCQVQTTPAETATKIATQESGFTVIVGAVNLA